MLYARMNKEYVNEDELAKSMVVSMYRKQNETMYGETKESSTKPESLTSQLKYGIDSLFENFRNSVEQILSADYNGDLTQQKGYEVIKKYNQLSSYLKNVINLKALSDTDQKAIEKQFDDLKEKLMLLKQIAEDNNFLDKDDIADMVDKVTKISKSKDLEKVSGKSTGLVENVQNKNTSVKQIEISINNLSDIDKLLNSPEIQNSTKLADMNLEYQTLLTFFSDPDLNPLETDMVQKNYDAVNTLKKFVEDSRNNFIDVKAKLQDSGNFIDNVLTYGFDDLDDIKIEARVLDIATQNKALLINARGAELKPLKKTSAKNAVNTKYDLELEKLKPNKKGFIALVRDEKKERGREYTAEFKTLENEYQQTETYKKNLDALDENALRLEEKEMNDILAKFENVKTNIRTTLDGMTDLTW